MASVEPLHAAAGLSTVLCKLTDFTESISFPAAFPKGGDAQVLCGPFADFSGGLEKVDRRGRILLLPEIMGRQVRIQIR